MLPAVAERHTSPSRPLARNSSRYAATWRAFRPSEERSRLKLSTSSMTWIGMTTLLSPNPKMERGSWRRTFVSRMKFFFKSRAPFEEECLTRGA